MKRLVLLLTALLLIVAPTFAQDEPEDPSAELLAVVTGVLEDMAALTAFRIDGNLSVDQRLQTGDTQVRTRFSQALDMNIARNADGIERMRAEMEQTINLGLGIGSGGLRLELLMPSASDGIIYARASDFSGLMLNVAGDEWVILGEDVGEAAFLNEAFPSTEALITSLSRIIEYPITDETVVEVRERRAQTIRYERGQYPSRRIEIVFDVPVLLEMGVLDSALRAVDAPALGLTNAELIDALMEGSRLAVNFFIDDEILMLRRIETEFSYDASFVAMGEEILLNQVSEGRFTYTQFDEDFEVNVPERFLTAND